MRSLVIEFVFENCEAYRFSLEDFIKFDISGVTKHIYKYKDDLALSYKTNQLFMIIDKKANTKDAIVTKYSCYSDLPFDRILRFADIVDIYIDDIQYTVFWAEGNEEINSAQVAYINKEGNLVIKIAEK